MAEVNGEAEKTRALVKQVRVVSATLKATNEQISSALRGTLDASNEQAPTLGEVRTVVDKPLPAGTPMGTFPLKNAEGGEPPPYMAFQERTGERIGELSPPAATKEFVPWNGVGQQPLK
jgi:hypothetical protein